MFRSRLRGFRINFLIFLGVLGPGIITASVDNDAGGIYTYSVAGAHFGYSLLWSFIPITVALIVIQEMVARMGVVTGKGLADLIREEYGFRMTFFLMILLLIANLGNTISEFAGIASGMSLFGVHRSISVPIAAVLVWFLIVKGTYRIVEKIFLVACVFYIAYPISAFMAHPDAQLAAVSTLRPALHLDSAYIYMLIGLVGTTIAPWMQFYLQSSVVDKGLKADDYQYARLDVIFGSVIVNAVAFFIIMLCAVTIFHTGVKIESAKDAALALAPLAGKYCTWLFAFGLLNASLFAASILPLSTAYTICEAFGWESSVNRKFVEAPQFYGLYSLMIILGAAVILFPGVPLIPIMFYSQVINGALLPFVLIFMLILVNDRKIMGGYKNGRALNFISILTILVLIFLSGAMILTALW
jgi:Mn2+/Fe2+ NRAMP family transporter